MIYALIALAAHLLLACIDTYNLESYDEYAPCTVLLSDRSSLLIYRNWS